MKAPNANPLFSILKWFQASSVPPAGAHTVTVLELQAWVTACRNYLQTDMGSYLLRSVRDDSLLLGDLHLHIAGMTAPLDTSAGENL